MTGATGKPGKVLVAMSGGVDSSVAAALLLRQGWDVVGCFMRLGSAGATEAQEDAPAPETHQGCCSLRDAADARQVAGLLDIPFYVLNFEQDFGRVIDYFVDEYNAGRTPNPCVRCNDWLKFGKLAAYARSLDAQAVATGHYARIQRVGGHARLGRGLDLSKDQSYVLFGAGRCELEHMILPLGELWKTQVRALAAELGLPVFDKPDSQEICFVPDNDYARLVRQRTPQNVREGDTLDLEGKVLGRHLGQQHFTIGQRRGLGVAKGKPLYVIRRDAASNTITLGGKEDLLSGSLQARGMNWHIDPPPPGYEMPCQVKIRYNSQPSPAAIRAIGPDALEARLDPPLAAVTPGQAVVFYEGDWVIGGGWITAAQ